MTPPQTTQADPPPAASSDTPEKRRRRLSPTVWVALLLILVAIGLLAWALFGPRSQYAPNVSTRTYTPSLDDTPGSSADSPTGNPLLPAEAMTADFDPPAGLRPPDGATPLYGRTHATGGMTHEMGYYAVPGDDVARVQQHYIGQAERLGFTREEISSHSTEDPTPHRVMFTRQRDTLMIDLKQRDESVRVLVWLSYTEGSR